MGKRILLWMLGLAFLTALGPADLEAQDRRITGRVTRVGTDQGIPNATVSVIGAARSASALTDSNGRFTLTAPVGEARLEVQALGFVRMEVIVAAGQSTVDIEMQQDLFQLDELVVTGQATTIERRSATTSVAYVSGDEVSRVTSPTVLNSLAGKITGVNIQTNSGAPGGGVQMQIRGNNTILGGFEPLYVVDGVIYSNVSIPSGRGYATNAGDVTRENDAVNRIADLNPADIASVEVLKGAAASSIYGSKAANGVVVITTVRGQSGAPQFNLTQRVGINTPLRKLSFRKWTLDEALDELNPSGNPQTEALIRAYFDGNPNPFYDVYSAVYDNRKPSYETLLDVRGGTESTRYYASGTVSREEGIERKTGAGRQSIRLNLDQTFSPRVDLRVSTAYNRSTNDRGWNGNCNNNGCHAYSLAYIPSFIDLTKKNPDGTYPLPTFGTIANSLQLSELGVNHEETNRFTGGFTFGWNALDRDRQSLRIVAGGGLDVFEQTNEVWTPNELYFEKTAPLPGEAIVSGGRSFFHNWNVNAIHNWDGGSWSAMTSFGLQYEDRRLHTSFIRTQGLLAGQRNVNRGVDITVNEFLERERTIALYASEALRFFDARLLLQGGLRAERSSVNGDTDRYFIYPNISTSYRFLDLIGAGSEVKVRAAYGETGNQPLFGQKFTTLATPKLGGQQGINLSTAAGYADVEPERLKEIEVGIDGIMFDNRVTWEVTGFTRNTTNLLLQRVPAPSSGFSSQVFNGGKIRNSGIEVGLGFTPIQSADLLWLTRTTFTRYTSEVVDLAGLPAFFPTASGYGNLGRSRVEEGRPITQIVGYDLNPDGTRSNELKQLGNSAPDFRVGFMNDISYRALNLNVLVDWQQGGSVINLTQYLQDHGKTSGDWGTKKWEERYKHFQAGSIRPYVEDGTFVKLREVALMVDVPSSFTQSLNLGLRNLRVGLTGRNLFMWTKYSGLDPEVSNYGAQAIRNNLDIGPYPPSRSFYFNLSVGF